MVSSGSDGSNRGRYIALIVAGLIVLASFIGLLAYSYKLGDMSGRKSAEAEGYAANYSYDTAQTIDKCYQPPKPISVQECVEEAIATGRENQRAEHDLEAQRNMADWAFWLLVFTISQIPIGLIGLYALIITIRQGRDANEISRDIGQAQARSYISIKSASVAIDDFGQPEVEIVVFNSGQSPARKFYWAHHVVFNTTKPGLSWEGYASSPSPEVSSRDIPVGKSKPLRQMQFGKLNKENKYEKVRGALAMFVDVQISIGWEDIFGKPFFEIWHFQAMCAGDMAFGQQIKLHPQSHAVTREDDRQN